MSIAEILFKFFKQKNQQDSLKLTPTTQPHPTTSETMSSDLPPEVGDHTYVRPSKDEDTSQSSSDSSSSESSSSSDSEPERASNTTKPRSSTSKDSVPEIRIRAPPDKYVDAFATFTPKTSPNDKRKLPKRLSTSLSRSTKEPIRKRKPRKRDRSFDGLRGRSRGMACGECEACKRDDCQVCVYCKDKVKFGGPGKKKQKCLMRVCDKMVRHRKIKQMTASPSVDISKVLSPQPDDTATSSASFKATPLPEQATPTTISVTPKPLIQDPPIIDLAQNLVKTMQTVGEAVTKLKPIAPKPNPDPSIIKTFSTVIATKPSPTKSTPTKQVKMVSPAKKVSPQGEEKKPTKTAVSKAITSLQSTFPKQSKEVTAPVSSNVKPVLVTPVSSSNKKTTTSSPKVTFSVAGSSSSSRQVDGWELNMKCIQCSRERKMSVARTPKFCTQRCIMNWLTDHPDKSPKDAVGDSNSPLFSLPALTTQPSTNQDKESASVKKPLSRALRNLQIDMAPPGTTLPQEEGEDDETEDERKTTTPSRIAKAVKISTSESNKKTRFSQPASSSAKRTVVTPQPSAIKKTKTVEKTRTESPNANSKSVKFNLSSTSISTTVTPPAVSYAPNPRIPGSISIVPLDRLSEFVTEQQKKFQDSATPRKKIKIPEGISRSVKDWTVNDVATYFKSTKECTEFGTIFTEQEVDGCALLQLTDEVMCRCLGLPLGKVVKAMVHIDELKKLALDKD